MAEAGLSRALGTALSIDAAEQFGQRVNSLMDLLGLHNRIAVQEGTLVRQYTTEVDLKGGEVEPGAVIPLSTVTRTPVEAVEMKFDKRRKGVPAEDIQKYGYEQAIQRSDRALLNSLQREVKEKLIGNLETGTIKNENDDFQSLLARNIASVKVAFDDDEPAIVSFVNTYDAYDYLGAAEIQHQTAFGLDYLEGFLGNDVLFISGDVPQGKVYTTAADNLNFYFVDVENGALSQNFEFETNDDGFIGVLHEVNNSRVQVETITLFAMLWLPERVDGIAVGDIVAPVDVANVDEVTVDGA